MPEFFQTVMGHRFYERDVPALVRQLARIADGLERLADAREPGPAAPEHEPKPDENPA